MTRDHTMDRRRLYGEIEPYASERHCQTKPRGQQKPSLADLRLQVDATLPRWRSG